jgi:hypothetical protein
MFVGCIIAYGIFTILRELSHDIRYKRIQDDRDTDERRIAGEDTSEVALNYLKIASAKKDLL